MSSYSDRQSEVAILRGPIASLTPDLKYPSFESLFSKQLPQINRALLAANLIPIIG